MQENLLFVKPLNSGLPIWRYGSTLSGTLSLLFSPSGTKALMMQFIYTISVGMAYTLQARSRYIDVPHATKLI